MERRKYQYRCVASSLEGLIQQVAVAYVARGYHFWVTGEVCKRISPEEHDRRLLEKFDVSRSKWSRYRRRQRGIASGRELANVQYIRFEDRWWLLATRGEHKFFDVHGVSESDVIRRVPEYHDVRKKPICYGGYSIGWYGRVSVRMTKRGYRELNQYYISLAQNLHSSERLEKEFWRGPFEPYGGVTRQMFAILRGVNKVRKVAGLGPAQRGCIRVKRKSVKPFDGFCRLKAGEDGRREDLRLVA